MAIFEYINGLYNPRRRHSALGWKSPVLSNDRWLKPALGAAQKRDRSSVALVLPRTDTQAMQLHLNEISKQVDTTAHAVVLMDRAGRYSTGKLKITKNLTNILLPPKTPELNPVKISGNTCKRTNSQAESLIPTRPSLRPPMRHEHAHQPTTNNHINRYERLGTFRSIISVIGIIDKIRAIAYRHQT
jgi:hypothetical protein